MGGRVEGGGERLRGRGATALRGADLGPVRGVKGAAESAFESGCEVLEHSRFCVCSPELKAASALHCFTAADGGEGRGCS